MNLKKMWWFSRLQVTKLFYGKVGKKSYLGKPLFIERKKSLFIGNRVRIYPGLLVEAPDKESIINFVNDISVGQNLHIVSYRDRLDIGDGTTISGNVFISNVDHGNESINVSALKQNLHKHKTKIGRNCFIGYGAVILPGTILGDNCIVGANAVVKGNYPENSMIVGVPGKIIKKYDLETYKWKKIEN